MKEIEKKYLLKDSVLSLIREYDLDTHKITQFYTTITAKKGVRYRQMGEHYFKTIKHGVGACRDEDEVEISEKKFLKKLQHRINEPIQKNRYMFQYKGAEYSIDIFKKELKGFYILEIEFPSMKAFKKFKLPKLFKEHVIKDVSFDEAFRNKNIVLHGRPQNDVALSTIFKALKTKSIDELDVYFIPNLSPINALRAILYKFSLSILFYKERVIAYDEEEDLHQFRVNIRKSRAFLKEFDFLFTKKQYYYFSEHLAQFAGFTNKKRDLDVIKERLLQLDEAHDMIQKDIKEQQESEHEKIGHMLEGETFNHFFYAYQSALKDETLVNTQNNSDTIKQTAKKVINDLHRHIIEKIDALEEIFEIEKLHKIRISLKKFRYLLEEFQHIFGEEKTAHMIAKGKDLQTLLGDFNDTVNQKKLLHTYFKKNKKKISHSKQFEHTLLEKTAKTEEKLLRKTMKKLRKFKKKDLEL